MAWGWGTSQQASPGVPEGVLAWKPRRGASGPFLAGQPGLARLTRWRGSSWVGEGGLEVWRGRPPPAAVAPSFQLRARRRSQLAPGAPAEPQLARVRARSYSPSLPCPSLPGPALRWASLRLASLPFQGPAGGGTRAPSQPGRRGRSPRGAGARGAGALGAHGLGTGAHGRGGARGGWRLPGAPRPGPAMPTRTPGPGRSESPGGTPPEGNPAGAHGLRLRLLARGERIPWPGLSGGRGN